jgi:hypothetical protein
MTCAAGMQAWSRSSDKPPLMPDTLCFQQGECAARRPQLGLMGGESQAALLPSRLQQQTRRARDHKHFAGADTLQVQDGTLDDPKMEGRRGVVPPIQGL